jgi:Fur family ferric uptake transcriptional regulator
MTTAAAAEPATEGAAERVRAAGLKVTAQRVAVLEALSGHAEHLDAESVFERVRRDLPTTSLQAVYGVLAALAGAGLLRKIEPAGSPALYESRIGDNHHHLACTSCHAVVDVECVVGEAPCLTPSNTNGFQIHTAEVTFWGLCSDCQRTASSEPKG